MKYPIKQANAGGGEMKYIKINIPFIKINIPFIKRYITVRFWKGEETCNGNGREYKVIEISFNKILGNGDDGNRTCEPL